jgi:integrase
MRAKITLRTVAALPTNSIVWDTVIHGFNARRQFSETVTYSIIYRNADQTQRWHKIGHHGVFTPELARQQARHILLAVATGSDPSAQRKALRNAITVAQLCDQYMEDMESGKINGKKASTIATDKSRIKHHIKPKIGKLKVITITQDQIELFMNELSQGSARRIIGLLSAIFTYAVKKKIRTDNPVRGIETPSDNKKTRRLSNAEYQQLREALNGGAALHPTVANIFLFLAVTGFRSGEAQLLKWAELDLERQCANLSDTKTGKSVRPLSSAAVEIINRQERKGDYVFTFLIDKPIGNVNQQWVKLQMPKDISPHTLRHSFASLAGDMGLADSTIAGLLGHARSSITSRYIHLDKALIAASDLVAGETMRLMNREESEAPPEFAKLPNRAQG